MWQSDVLKVIPEGNEMFWRHRAEHYDSGKNEKNDFFGNPVKHPLHLLFHLLNHAILHPKNNKTSPSLIFPGHCPPPLRTFLLLCLFLLKNISKCKKYLAFILM